MLLHSVDRLVFIGTRWVGSGIMEFLVRLGLQLGFS